MSTIGNLFEVAEARRQAAEEDAQMRAADERVEQIHQGAQERASLDEEEEQWLRAVPEAKEKIAAAEETITRLEKELEEAGDIESLSDQPDLYAQAVEKVRSMQAELAQATAQLQEARTLLATAQTEQADVQRRVKSVIERTRPVVGEKELPQKLADEMWRLMEQERELAEMMQRYIAHAQKQAEACCSEAISSSSSKREFTSIYVTTGRYLWGIPDELKGNPRFVNAYRQAFSQAIQEVIKGTRKVAKWSGKGSELADLTEEEKALVRDLRYEVVFKPNEQSEPTHQVLIRDGENKIPFEPVPELSVFSELTPEEKKYVLKAIEEKRWHDRASFEKGFRLAAYRPEVFGAIKEAAVAEDREFAAGELEKKRGEVEAEKARLAVEIQQAKERQTKLERALVTVRQINKLSREIQSLEYDICDLETRIRGEQTQQKRCEIERAKLPRHLRFVGIGGGVKDKEQEQRLTALIEDCQKAIGSLGQQKSNKQEELARVQTQRASLVEKLRSDFPEMVNEQGEVGVKEYNFESQIYDHKRKVEDLEARVKVVEAAMAEWEKGRFLVLTLPEMEFVVKISGTEKNQIDFLAGQLSGELQRKYLAGVDRYGLPDLTISVKGKEFFCRRTDDTSPGLGYGLSIQRVEGGTWDKFIKLDSRRLALILEEEIKKKLISGFNISAERAAEKAPKIRFQVVA